LNYLLEIASVNHPIKKLVLIFILRPEEYLASEGRLAKEGGTSSRCWEVRKKGEKIIANSKVKT